MSTGEPFVLEAPGIRPGDRVLGFHGVEEVDEPYRYLVSVRMRSDGVDALEDAVGDPVSLRCVDEPDAIHGLLVEVSVVEEEEGQTVVAVEIRPRWWRLVLTRHSRVFTDKSTPEVIELVLAEHGVAYDLQLGETYETREHRCQYRESDFAFLSRWMEREGIFYYFRHDGDAETMVICDGERSFGGPRGDAVPYRPRAVKDLSAGRSFSRFRPRSRLTTGAVALRGYDDCQPKLELRGEVEVPNRSQEVTVDHLANVRAPAEAERLAKVHAERVQNLGKRFLGHGQVYGLHAGHAFGLVDHPRDALNGDYVAKHLEIYANFIGDDDELAELLELPYGDEMRIEVDAQRADTPHRPDTTTPWPRIYGIENAIVDGAGESPYAQVDDRGRYKIRVLFDEADHGDGSASTWVRMAQPHGGENEGFHFPLRKGTEVMLSFMGGDPDQPLITGVLPNDVTPSPVTSKNAVENVIRTGALNELVMGDEGGKEFVHLATPHMATSIHMGEPDAEHHLEILTDGDAHTGIKGKLDEEIEGSKVQKVTGFVEKTHLSDETETIFGTGSYQIGGDKMSLVMNNEASVTIGNRSSVTIGNSASMTMGNSMSRTVGMTVSEFVGVSISNCLADSFSNVIGNRFSTIAGNSVSHTVGNSVSTFVGNSTSTFLGAQQSLTVADKTSITVGTDTSMTLAAKNFLTVGAETGITVAANTKINVATKTELNAAIELSLTAALGVAFKVGKVEEVPLKSETAKTSIMDEKLQLLQAEVSLLQASMLMLGK